MSYKVQYVGLNHQKEQNEQDPLARNAKFRWLAESASTSEDVQDRDGHGHPCPPFICTAAVSASGNMASGHRPVRVCKDYSVLLSPLGKHCLLGDEPVPPVWGVFVEKILVALILPLLIVMIGDFSIPFCPGKETRREGRLSQGRDRHLQESIMCPVNAFTYQPSSTDSVKSYYRWKLLGSRTSS